MHKGQIFDVFFFFMKINIFSVSFLVRIALTGKGRNSVEQVRSQPGCMNQNFPPQAPLTRKTVPMHYLEWMGPELFHLCPTLFHQLSNPRAKRAGPKCLRAESARAVTGRRCPHSGKEEDFLMAQLIFFTETAATLEREVEKSFPRQEINRHAEG